MADASRQPDSSGTNPVPARMLLMAVFLAVAWLLWSGLYKPLLLGLGLVSVLLTLYLLRRMGYFRDEGYAFRYGLRLLVYWAWLGKEIFKSGFEVARLILSPTIRPEPRTVAIDVRDLNIVDQTTFGNSITLTPGTLTLDAYKGRLLVHALTAEGAADLEAGRMLRRIAALRS